MYNGNKIHTSNILKANKYQKYIQKIRKYACKLKICMVVCRQQVELLPYKKGEKTK